MVTAGAGRRCGFHAPLGAVLAPRIRSRHPPPALPTHANPLLARLVCSVGRLGESCARGGANRQRVGVGSRLVRIRPRSRHVNPYAHKPTPNTHILTHPLTICRLSARASETHAQPTRARRPETPRRERLSLPYAHPKPMTQPQKSLSSYARVTSPSPSLARPPSGSSVTLPCSPSISPARCTRVLLSTAHHRGRGGGRGPTTHARASTRRRVGAGVTSDVGIDVGPPSLPSLRSCFSLACCSLCFRFSCVRRRWFVLSTCGGGSCAEETGACAAFSLFFFMAAAYGPLMCPVYGCLSTPIL